MGFRAGVDDTRRASGFSAPCAHLAQNFSYYSYSTAPPVSRGALLSNPGEYELAGEDRKFTASLLEAAQVTSVFAREVNGFGGRHDVEDPGRGVDAHDDSAGCIYRISS
jgi:hypothetical protein